MGDVFAIAVLVVVYGVVSRRVRAWPVTAPMVFVGMGIVLGPAVLDLLDVRIDQGAVGVLAEGTLVLLLYTDAIRIDLRRLRRHAAIPARLLGIGLPLTVVAGTGVGVLLLDGLSVWEVVVLAAVLSPTDAALGQAVVTSPDVPRRIRQALNVESGLNDGLVLPLVTITSAVAAGMASTGGELLGFVLQQIGLGAVLGAVAGYGGGRLVDVAVSRGWMDGLFRQLSTLAIGVIAFAGAELVEGNGFVAAFVAGLAFGAGAREQCDGAQDFAEDEGHLLALLTFLFFGAAIAGPALRELTFQVVLYAIAALTVVRMVSVAVALLGSGLRSRSVAFLGWFGPRGLASMLFALFVLERNGMAAGDRIVEITAVTVVISVLAHGATAGPLSERYASWFESIRREDMPEALPAPDLPTP